MAGRGSSHTAFCSVQKPTDLQRNRKVKIWGNPNVYPEPANYENSAIRKLANGTEIVIGAQIPDNDLYPSSYYYEIIWPIKGYIMCGYIVD